MGPQAIAATLDGSVGPMAFYISEFVVAIRAFQSGRVISPPSLLVAPIICIIPESEFSCTVDLQKDLALSVCMYMCRWICMCTRVCIC